MNVPVHPCGKVVDMIRDPYLAMMRPWSNSDEEIQVRWFRAPAGAEVIPGPHPYGSSYWVDPIDGVPPVGEHGPRTYGPGLGGNPLGYLGKSQCGTQLVWREGGVLGVDPEHETDDEGVCGECVMASMVAEGGQQQGTGRPNRMVARGGQQQYGLAVMFPVPTMTAEGGQEQGGTAIMGYEGIVYESANQYQGGAAYQGVPIPIPHILDYDSGTATGNFSVTALPADLGTMIFAVVAVPYSLPLPTPSWDGHAPFAFVLHSGATALFLIDWMSSGFEPATWNVTFPGGPDSAWFVCTIGGTASRYLTNVAQTGTDDTPLVSGLLTLVGPTLNFAIECEDTSGGVDMPAPFTVGIEELSATISLSIRWALEAGGLVGNFGMDAFFTVNWSTIFQTYRSP